MFKSPADILDALKEKRLRVAKLSTETGIPSSRIYKWKDRGSKITSEDAEILKEWIAKLDNSKNNGHQNDLQTIVRDLTESGIRYQAAITVLSITLAELVAKQPGKSIGSVSSELQRAISLETHRLLDERKRTG